MPAAVCDWGKEEVLKWVSSNGFDQFEEVQDWTGIELLSFAEEVGKDQDLVSRRFKNTLSQLGKRACKLTTANWISELAALRSPSSALEGQQEDIDIFQDEQSSPVKVCFIRNH